VANPVYERFRSWFVTTLGLHNHPAFTQGWRRIAVLVSSNDEDDLWGMDAVSFREVRCYDLSDHAAVARQFVRELVLQGITPDVDAERIVVIGGDARVEQLPGTELQTTKVPFTVWKPVAPPPTPPQWGVHQV
jgi:hypothetical protein